MATATCNGDQVDACLENKEFEKAYRLMMADQAPCIDPLVFVINESQHAFFQWMTTPVGRQVMASCGQTFDWSRAADIANVCGKPQLAKAMRQKQAEERASARLTFARS